MYTCIVKTELRIVIVGSTSPELSDDDEVLYNDGISSYFNDETLSVSWDDETDSDEESMMSTPANWRAQEFYREEFIVTIYCNTLHTYCMLSSGKYCLVLKQIADLTSTHIQFFDFNQLTLWHAYYLPTPVVHSFAACTFSAIICLESVTL